jgi:2-methylcitrate dehydratase PrpD
VTSTFANAADPSLTARLAMRLLGQVAPDVQAKARLHLLDWIGCICGAWESEVATIARRAEPDPLARYALLGNVLEMDDVHRAAILHPGPVVWPAALSAARDKASTLGAVLEAGVRGYEAMITLGSSFDAHHYAHFHTTSTAGNFGAVAALGSIYNFDAAHYVWGFGNAGSLAGGLWHMRHDPQSMTKQLHVAHAVMAGVWIGRLAAQGFRGPPEILEGKQGLFAATTRAPKMEAFDFSDDWSMCSVSFKPWAACRHAHPAIDAALELRKFNGANGNIIVETYKDALTFCDKPTPQSVIEAKFSIQHAVAIAMERGAPTLGDFELDAIHDPALIAARARIQVREHPDFTGRYPAHFGARILAIDAEVEVTDTRGDPERPLGRDGVIDKAQTLMAWGGIHNADAIIDWVLNAPLDCPARELLELLP